MGKEWFTIPELRAMRIDYFGADALRTLAEIFERIPATLARVRRPEFAAFSLLLCDAEFNIACFPAEVQEEMRRAVRDADDITRRVMKLGLQRHVLDRSSQYVSTLGDDELAEFESLLRRRHEVRQG